MNGRTALPWDKYDAYREVTAYPDAYDKERFSLRSLWDAAAKADVLFRGWPFIYVDPARRDTRQFNDRICTEVLHTGLRGYEAFERWELRQSGLFFHRALMDEETYPEARRRGKMIDFTLTIYHIAEAIGSLWRLYEALEVRDEEPVSIEFRYTGMEGRKLDVLDIRRWPLNADQLSAESVIERTRRMPLGEWRASDAEVAAEILVELFERFGWLNPNVAEISKVTHEFLAKPRFGYGYP